jgi:ABC-type transporter MlaC component
MNPWVSIVLALIPEIQSIVAAIAALRKQYPQLTPEQIQAIIADVTSQADTAFDSALAKIAADQAAHPPV